MLSERDDLEYAADLLLRSHGFKAHRVAASRAYQFLREGETSTGEFWLRIATRLSFRLTGQGFGQGISAQS
jgi:hypothetical protein